jgi:hypothetical protein
MVDDHGPLTRNDQLYANQVFDRAQRYIPGLMQDYGSGAWLIEADGQQYCATPCNERGLELVLLTAGGEQVVAFTCYMLTDNVEVDAIAYRNGLKALFRSRGIDLKVKRWLKD